MPQRSLIGIRFVPGHSSFSSNGRFFFARPLLSSTSPSDLSSSLSGCFSLAPFCSFASLRRVVQGLVFNGANETTMRPPSYMNCSSFLYSSAVESFMLRVSAPKTKSVVLRPSGSLIQCSRKRWTVTRSEEHTSELQSPDHLV